MSSTGGAAGGGGGTPTAFFFAWAMSSGASKGARFGEEVARLLAQLAAWVAQEAQRLVAFWELAAVSLA